MSRLCFCRQALTFDEHDLFKFEFSCSGLDRAHSPSRLRGPLPSLEFVSYVCTLASLSKGSAHSRSSLLFGSALQGYVSIFEWRFGAH